MKPQSKSKTFANEAGPANSPSVPPEDGIGVTKLLREPISNGASTGLAPEVADPVVIDDSISDLEYLKSRVRTSGTTRVSTRDIHCLQ